MPDPETATVTPLAKRERSHVRTGRPRGRPKGSKTRQKPPEELPPPVKPAAFRIPGAAVYMNVSESLIAKWIRDKVIIPVRIGGTTLIPTKALDALLERRP